VTPESSPVALPRDEVGAEDYDAEGRFLYPGDVEDAMPEGNLAWWLGVYLVQAISRLVADPARASVHANMPIYYVKGAPRRHVSPDAFYLPGVPMDRRRRSYCLWKTGVVPQVAFEVLSRHHEHKDEVRNRAIYQELGVGEYYWFDPERTLLTALALHPGTKRYRTRRPDAAGRYASAALGLEVGLEDGLLALYHAGRYLEPLEDLALRLRAEGAAALAAKDAELAAKNAALTAKDAELTEKDAELAEKDAEIEALRRRLGRKDGEAREGGSR